MRVRTTLLFLSALVTTSTLNAGYILGTPSVAVNTDGWALFDSAMTGLNGALQDPAKFGPGGAVNQALTLVQLSTFTAGDLSGINGLIVPWWLDSESTSFAPAIIAAFNAGMDLILLEDDTDHDFIGESLGLPTSASDGSGSTASGPFATGPFGSPAAGSVNQSGNTGQKLLATILALGGTAGATNGSGEVTAAYWARGTFNGNPNAGALVIFGDVDMASDFVAAYSPLNDNGKFTLNGIAFVAGQGASINAVPEPGTWMLLTAGAGVLALLKRRGQRH